MTTQLSILDFIEGAKLRDEGILKAVTHADKVKDNWSGDAIEMLKEFIRINPGEFMCEDFRSYCAVIDFPLPPHARAFGHVIRKAGDMGIIEFIRYDKAKNPKCHRTPVSVWRAKV